MGQRTKKAVAPAPRTQTQADIVISCYEVWLCESDVCNVYDVLVEESWLLNS